MTYEVSAGDALTALPGACCDGTFNMLASEACDDGNAEDTDACVTGCQRAVCGDGFTHTGMEECDDGNADDTDFCVMRCEAASCMDGLRHGQEAELDCGGACSRACINGQCCSAAGDCFSGVCSEGVCTTTARLVAGFHHTCVLLEGGDVRCWGYNGYAQLGYGHTDTIGDNEAPSSVGTVDMGGRAVQLAAGGWHTCALLEGGDVRCWGYNGYGQLDYGHTDMIGDNEVPSWSGVLERWPGVLSEMARDTREMVRDTRGWPEILERWPGIKPELPGITGEDGRGYMLAVRRVRAMSRPAAGDGPGLGCGAVLRWEPTGRARPVNDRNIGDTELSASVRPVPIAEPAAAGYFDFDRIVYCFARTENYDPGLAAIASA